MLQSAIVTNSITKVLALSLNRSNPLVRANLLDMNVAMLLVAVGVGIPSKVVGINMSNLSLMPIENLGNLLEGWALCLDIEEGDEDEFEEDPDLRVIRICSWKIEMVVVLTA